MPTVDFTATTASPGSHSWMCRFIYSETFNLLSFQLNVLINVAEFFIVFDRLV